MDGREGMTLQGSPSYYLNRTGIGGSSASAPSPNFHHGGGGGGLSTAAHQAAGIHPSHIFKNLPNPTTTIPPQPNVNTGGGTSVITSSSFHNEIPPPSFHHGRSLTIVPTPSQSGDPVKKKRGRPRKYAPDGANTSLGLSPLSASKRSSAVDGSGEKSGEKSRRGRPPGTGWKQQLAPLGDWMNSSAGLAFTPHVLHVGVGEDIAAKLLAFAQQRSRALCIMSATGSVSAITLRQPTSSAATVTYEGRFEILCLSGSYLVSENGGPHNRTGGISISVCSPDGHMIGGAIGGRLIAANPVQVVACSFIYGGGNNKPKSISGSKDEKLMIEHSSEKSLTPTTAASTQNFTPNSGISAWPPISRPEVKNSQTGIDLMRG